MDAGGHALTAAAGREGARRDVARLLALFLAGRLITALVAGLWLAVGPGVEADTLADLLCRWDCRWYVQIAETGYDPVAQHWERGDGSNWAFFPLLPVLMAGVTGLTGLHPLLSGYVVANLGFLVAVLAFHAYLKDATDPRFAAFGAGLFALWPWSLHATVPMSEAVFVPAAILTFLFARRGWWIAAGLAAAALSASRAVGVFAVLPLLLLAVQQFGWRALVTLRPDAARAILALALSGFGLGLFMAHLWFRTGDALAFSHIQTAWSRAFAFPWDLLIDDLSPWFRGWEIALRKAPHLLTAAAGLLLTAVLVRRRFLPEAAFVWAVLAVAFTSGSAMSFSRFTGALFPLVLAVALVMDRPDRRRTAWVAAPIGLAVMTFFWVSLWNYAM